jgi:hypothetical protein
MASFQHVLGLDLHVDSELHHVLVSFHSEDSLFNSNPVHAFSQHSGNTWHRLCLCNKFMIFRQLEISTIKSNH